MKMCRLLSAALALLLVPTMLLVPAVLLVAEDAKPAKLAEKPENVVYDADSAFEFLKTLAGTWEHSGDGHDHGSTSNQVVYRTTAAGSTVMETIFPGEEMEMISMYHRDGDNLLLTHFCSLQNVPLLKFEKTGKPGEIKFAFSGGTNFDPQTDTHVHEGVFQVKDANTIDATFVGYSGGKADHTSKGTLKCKTGMAKK